VECCRNNTLNATQLANATNPANQAGSALPFVYQVHPEIVVVGTGAGDRADKMAQGAFPVHPFATLVGRSKYSQPFAILNLGNSSEPADRLSGSQAHSNDVTFGVQIGSRLFAHTVKYEAQKPTPVSVRMAVQTAHVHSDDSTMAVAYQLLGANGESSLRLDAGFFALEIVGVNKVTDAVVTAQCPSPALNSAIGSCALEAPQSWFTSFENVPVALSLRFVITPEVGPQHTVSSEHHHAVLWRFPTESARSYSAAVPYELVAVLPTREVFPNDTVVVPVSVNHLGVPAGMGADAGADLQRVVVDLQYGPHVLRLVDYEFAQAFRVGHTLVHNGTAGTIAINVHRGAAAVDNLSPGVLVLLTFRVVPRAAPGGHEELVSMTGSFLDGAEQSLNDEGGLAGLFNDFQGTYHPSGSLMVRATGYVAIFAYTTQNELVNTASLTGLSSSSGIEVFGARNRYTVDLDEAFVSVTDYSVCSGPEDLTRSVGAPPALNTYNPTTYVLDVHPGCLVSVSQQHFTGKSVVPVSVEFGHLSASVVFRVWFAQRAKVLIKDPILNRIV